MTINPRDTDWYADGWFPTDDGYVIIGDIPEAEVRHRAAMLWHDDTWDSWEESIQQVDTYTLRPFTLRDDWQRCDDNDPIEAVNGGLKAWLLH